MHRFFARLAVLTAWVLASAGASPAAGATLWDFRVGGNPEIVTGSAFTLHRNFSAGSLTVDVSAWSNTGITPAGSLAGGYLGRYDTGLGVCNKNEALVAGNLANCVFDGGIRNQVDNVGQQDLVLFVFSATQALESITIDPYGAFDRDLSFWVGNVTTPLDLAGRTFASLAGIGFGPKTDSLNGVGGDPLTISLGGAVGNALLVGALYPSDSVADKFKIQSITSTSVVPVPGAIWLFGSSAALGAVIRRRVIAAS